MHTFKIPTRSEVSENNKFIFDELQKNLGFVPNLYAYYAKNETALSDYLVFQNRKSTLKAKEREIINLVVSQINGCKYCQSAPTLIFLPLDNAYPSTKPGFFVFNLCLPLSCFLRYK